MNDEDRKDSKETACVGCLETTAVWLDAEADAEWDSFVTRHPLGLVYHSTSWRNALEYAFPHIRGRFLALREGASGRLIAGMPVYTVRSRLLGNRIVSIPFASFCDPLISTREDFRALLGPLKDLLGRSRFGSVEIRSMKTSDQVADSGLTPVPGYKHHYIPLAGGLEAVFRRFSKSCVQRLIRRAQGNGMAVTAGDGKEDLQIFYDILTATRRRLCLPPIPLRFFEGIWKHLGPSKRRLFIGWNNSAPVGCLLTLNHGDMWAVEYSGDVRAAQNSGINQLLYWEAIRLAHSEGAGRFSLGRTSVSNQGLIIYKRRWGTEEEPICHSRFFAKGELSSRSRSHSISESVFLRNIVRLMVRLTPLPLYHRLGRYFYRHWG